MSNSETPWLGKKVPNGYWKSLQNRRVYLRWLGERLGFTSEDDWYQLEGKHFSKENRGVTLYCRFYNDPKKAVKELFPEREWHPWLFRRAGNGFWKVLDNRLSYLRWLESRLGFSSPEDWYSITRKDFENNRGAGLLTHAYSSHLNRAPRELYPESDWKPWLFKITPQTFFAKQGNRRKFLNWIAEENEFDSLDDWYGVAKYFVLLHPGGGMIENYYNGSISKMLSDIYPEHDWELRKFIQAPTDYWMDDENVLSFLNELAEKLGYKEMDDWYQLSQRELAKHGGGALHNRFSGSPLRMLKHIFPEHDWLEFRFSMAPKGYWDSHKNLVRYMDWLGAVLGFMEMDDWYEVRTEDFNTNYGAGAPFSPSNAVMTAYPEHGWEEERFIHRGFQPHLPGYYYVNEIINSMGDRIFFKGGISRDWKHRLVELSKGLPEGLTIRNIETKYFERGQKAWDLEKELLKIKSIRAPKRDFDGGTELFLVNPLNYIRESNLKSMND